MIEQATQNAYSPDNSEQSNFIPFIIPAAVGFLAGLGIVAYGYQGGRDWFGKSSMHYSKVSQTDVEAIGEEDTETGDLEALTENSRSDITGKPRLEIEEILAREDAPLYQQEIEEVLARAEQQLYEQDGNADETYEQTTYESRTETDDDATDEGEEVEYSSRAGLDDEETDAEEGTTEAADSDGTEAETDSSKE
tara:strand:+ start:1402 stop:1983 length:582 start_codon:yes stop_codon:yes gene_type:complete